MLIDSLSQTDSTIVDAMLGRDRRVTHDPATADATASIRAFERRDIPRVADMFLKTFRAGRSDRRPALCAAIEEVYFGSPAYRPEAGSIVHVDA